MNKRIQLKIFLGFLTAACSFSAFAQQTMPQWPVKNPQFLQGFEVKVRGEVLDFLPGLTNGQVALLVRANPQSQPLEFQSSTIPGDSNAPYISLVWSAAISKQQQQTPGKFVLSINNEQFFTFQAHQDSLHTNWTLSNRGADLSFIATEITKPSQDAFGYMFLNLPADLVKKGERINISVSGVTENNSDWYMPFGIPVTNEQSVLAEPALVKTKSGVKQRVRVEIKHAAAPARIQFNAGNLINETHDLKPGKRVFYLLFEPVTKNTDINLTVAIGKSKSQHRLVLKPVRKFEVYYLPHSHIDIGFTHRQDDVEKLQWKNLELAIELAEKTKDYPDGSKFKWNAEITWAVDGYLKHASEEKRQRFLDAVKKGWIGLDAVYASQLTGLQREEEMINNQRYAGLLKDKYGMEITTAMSSDVPGYTWGTVESLAQSGVRYFSSGPNHMPHLPHGGYQVGHTFEAWGDVPFYWSSASGKQKILFWMTSHGYSWFHSWSVDILSKSGGDPIVKFLDELENQQYPYDIVQLRYTIGNDNGPPDETMPDFIRRWNETYAWPKMRIATTLEMMTDFEKRYGSQLPTYKGDFTPYWEDGAASSALETGINRKTADRLSQTEALAVMLDAPLAQERFDAAWRNTILFSEHTWGANISKSQPDSEFTKDLWQVKQSYALDAERESNLLLNDALAQVSTDPASAKSFLILNTSSWPRSGLVILPASWNLGEKKVTDQNGKSIEFQILKNGDAAMMAVDVPAFGSKKYVIGKRTKRTAPVSPIQPTTLTNGLVTLKFNESTGDIIELSAGNGQNLIDNNDTLGFNAYWYGGLIKSNLQKQGKATFEVIENGPVLSKIRITSPAPGAERLVREVQLTKGSNEIYLTNIVDKKRVVADENVRFAFPFNISNSQVRIDVPWATVRPELDQLKGANKNFFSVQRWVDVSNEETGVTLAPIEAPLLEIGDMYGQTWMTDMRVRPWIKKYEPSNRLFSWVMNNAWFVNYKAYQEGTIPFHYVLRPHGRFNHSEAKKFGMEQTQPLLAVAVKEDAGEVVPVLSFAKGESIVVTSMKRSKDGKAIMIRLFNTSESAVQDEILWKKIKPVSVHQSSAHEERGAAMTGSISLIPWEVTTIRVELK